MEWKLREASSEADDMIEACVDEFIASKFRWLPFRNLSITGILILPAILTLTYYCIRHFSYLMGNQAAFDPVCYQYTLLHLQVGGQDPYYATNHNLRAFAFPQLTLGFRF